MTLTKQFFDNQTTKNSTAATTLSKEKVFLIYKFAETSEAMIDSAIREMGDSTQARAYFRKIALLVHPDKNEHPLANTVFQKISNALQMTASVKSENLSYPSRCNDGQF